MKKILLMMVALVATVSISAKDDEGWSKSFAPVSDKAELGGLCTAVAGDGSVYASSTYNQAFTFAGKAVADPDGLTSSCIVKYDKDGAEQWAISLIGKCTIDAMTADADGTLYVTGDYADAELTLSGTSGSKVLSGDVSKTCAFVAKVSADGVIENVISIASESLDQSEIVPSKIVIDNEKVYTSCSFCGGVASLNWEGSYQDLFGWMYYDIKSYGIFSLKKTDLSELSSVATLQRTPLICNAAEDELANGPEALDFVIYEGVPHIAFVGWGDVKLTTATDNKDFSFGITPDPENPNGGAYKEHGMVLANISNLNFCKKFSAAGHKADAIPYKLVGATIAGENCILAGTFYGNFPLDNAITVDEDAAFVASIDMKECTLNWRYIPNVHAEATCMIVTGEETHLATAEKKYTVKTADGKEKDIMDQGFADASSYNDQYCSTIFANDANVCIFSPKLKPSNVKTAQDVQNGDVKVYTLEGIEHPALQKGLNLIKTAEGTQKVLK